MAKTTRGIEFYKMHGCGNDFIAIDNRHSGIPVDEMGDLAKKFCQRGFGVGADGMFFLDRPEDKSRLAYVWHFFNRDGSVGEICGNASRCAALLANHIGLAPADHSFGTLAGPVRARVIDNGLASGDVRVRLPGPEGIMLQIGLNIDGREFWAHHIIFGVPHAVIFTQDLEDIDVCRIGRMIRYHPQFSPTGVNVDFARILDRQTIQIRTYERGVEDETFACGTGAASTQFISCLLGKSDNTATVRTLKEGALIIEVVQKEVFLRGPARLTFTGEAFL